MTEEEKVTETKTPLPMVGVEPLVVARFGQLMIDAIILAGGQQSTAYKCAAVMAEDLEKRINEKM